MLLSLNVENFRSFKEGFELSLIASADKTYSDTHTRAIPNLKHHAYLVSTGIYGANGSGKTGVLQALMIMRRLVLESARESMAGDPLPIDPFRFTAASRTSPTRIEVVFAHQGIRYQFGFIATKTQIIEEWLYATPHEGRLQKWYQRVWNEETTSYEWMFGSRFQGLKKLWQEATAPNALFLSVAVRFNSSQLKPIYDWFKSDLVLLRAQEQDGLGFTLSQCETTQGRAQVLAFMKQAGIGLNEILFEAKDVNEEMIPEELQGKVSVDELRKIFGDKLARVEFLYEGADTDGAISLGEESNGTQQLFSLAAPIMNALQTGATILCDELDASLHPRLAAAIIQLFHQPETNPKGAQLIFNGHNTAFLDQDIFRRDQIWFTEKDRHGASRLYPLSDFKPRKKFEPLQKGYLGGRYGGLPILPPVHQLAN